jgi:hypothetical protein
VVANAPRLVALDEIVGGEDSSRFDLDVALLANLANSRLGYGLSQLDSTTRDAPEAKARLSCPLHKQDSVVLNHDCSDPNDGGHRILATHPCILHAAHGLACADADADDNAEPDYTGFTWLGNAIQYPIIDDGRAVCER